MERQNVNNCYVTILDFIIASVIIIHLTEEEVIESEKYDDFEAFLVTLEDKYNFSLSNSQWMVSDTLNVYHYEGGKTV